jgi:flavin reductase (DIM6/NTAB) family NADH-FMN oxidoreductase RutF
MLTIEPGKIPTGLLHSHLLAAVAPRPIAFASTMDKHGNPNLSPFSFFNVFGVNPPIAIFSPARRVKNNTIKHTLENVMETGEVVINIVNYSMVQQASLASTEYAKGINEFEKSGFTPIPSEKVKPFRVKESPVQLECKVNEIIHTGSEGGAGNLIICEILLVHISEDVLDANGKIDQHKIDVVGRLGGDWYVRANGNALFEVEKPLITMGVGVDQLPESIRLSNILTGNNLGQLGNIEHIPTKEESTTFIQSADWKALINQYGLNKYMDQPHELAKQLLEKGHVKEAWYWLISSNYE